MKYDIVKTANEIRKKSNLYIVFMDKHMQPMSFDMTELSHSEHPDRMSFPAFIEQVNKWLRIEDEEHAKRRAVVNMIHYLSYSACCVLNGLFEHAHIGFQVFDEDNLKWVNSTTAVEISVPDIYPFFHGNVANRYNIEVARFVEDVLDAKLLSKEEHAEVLREGVRTMVKNTRDPFSVLMDAFTVKNNEPSETDEEESDTPKQ